MLNNESNIVPACYEDIYDEYFKYFLSKANNIDDTYIIPYEIYAHFDILFHHMAFAEVLHNVIYEAYLKHIKPLPLQELLGLASEVDELAQLNYEQLEDNQFSNKSEALNYHLISVAEDEFTQPYLSYFVMAIMQFTQLLTYLQSTEINDTCIGRLLDMQKSFERGYNALQILEIKKNFAGYINPKKIQEIVNEAVATVEEKHLQVRKGRAANAAKVRANKLYGKTKKYAKERYEQIKKINPAMERNQVVIKICKSIEENPQKGDRLLGNPYVTVSDWVKKLDNGEDITK